MINQEHVINVDLFHTTTGIGDWERQCEQITRRYNEQCTDEETYSEAGLELKRHREKYGLSLVHLEKRAHYEEYADMLTHCAEERFIHCNACRRSHCTDPWQPFGYSPVWHRLLWACNEKVYYCVQKEGCRK
jgi:hypothetical protein